MNHTPFNACFFSLRKKGQKRMLVSTGLYWRRDEVGRWGMKERDFKEKGLQNRMELRCMESLRTAYNRGFTSCMHNPGFITAPKSYFVKRQVQWLILCHILNELMHTPRFTQVIRWQMFYLARNFKYSLSHSVGYSFIHSFIHSHNTHLLSLRVCQALCWACGYDTN